MTSPIPPKASPRRAWWVLVSSPSAPGVSPLWWVTGPVLATLLVTVVVILARPVPYVWEAPGGARPVESLISIERAPDGPAVKPDRVDDDLLYLTVSIRDTTGLEALYGLLNDKIEVLPSKLLYGTQTSDENTRLNQAFMTDSQDKARKVALERLGYDVKTTPVGAFVEDVDPTYPVAKVLKPGATIVAADGKSVKTRDELVAAIGAHQPGEQIEIRFVPLGSAEEVTEKVELGSRQDDPKRPVLGVTPADRLLYKFPVKITIDTRKVGGPSAGLAFTLAILDRLTPGRLLGDNRVAVTGTIELDGSVGPIGGVDHKAEAAIEQGADLMIVPPLEYEQARDTAHGRIEVEKASTVDEALKILAEHGGDPLPEGD